MEQRAFRIHGRVQGVGFRWWTRSRARGLELSGTVRNCDDGTVEVRALGPAEALAELRALLHQGPSGASVQRVDEQEVDDVPTAGFEIIH